jgi:uncharacterized protein
LGLSPLAANERIVSLDVLRGLSILGILPMNIQSFAMISAAYSNPTVYGDLHGVNYLVWLVSHVLADQKFMTIFSMLFGAGIFLMTSRIEANGKRSAALHYRRMLWLIVFGVLHAYLLWSGDILYDYGICGMLVFPFRKLRPGTLIVVGLLSVLLSSALMSTYGWLVAHSTPDSIQALRAELWQPTPDMIAQQLATYRGSWRTQMRGRVPDAQLMETVLFYWWGLWRETGLMLVGIAFFKTGVFSAARSRSFYWKLIGVAVFIGIPITIYGTYRDFASGWDFQYSFFSGMQINHWASILVALGWIGVVMFFFPSNARLAAVGRMAFTNYIMQTVICTTIFFGHGFGLYGKVERVWQFAIVVVVWLLQLSICPIWLRYFRFGPLEWVWRSLTYLRCEPAT